MECFNLICRLLVLFSITLALIGIWQSWDKFFLFLLLFTTCLLICGRWVRDMYSKFVFCCLWMRGRVVTSFRTLVVEASNYLARKIQNQIAEIFGENFQVPQSYRYINNIKTIRVLTSL